MMNWNEGITVTVPDQAALLHDLDRCLEEEEGFAVATLNLDHVVKLAKSADFRTAYANQTHVTADGNPIVWLSRLAGQQVSLVPGSELIDPVVALAAKKSAPIALYGASQDALDRAGQELKRRYPDLKIAFARAPAMGFDPAGQIAADDIAAIGASGARICFLALGAPKQEVFAAHALGILSGVGFVSIGAGLDFIAGTQKRAPVWVQRIAAEWLWRMVSNPRRLVLRYGACLLVLPRMTLRAAAARRQGRSDAAK